MVMQTQYTFHCSDSSHPADDLYQKTKAQQGNTTAYFIVYSTNLCVTYNAVDVGCAVAPI